jgi:hypothetical protein
MQGSKEEGELVHRLISFFSLSLSLSFSGLCQILEKKWLIVVFRSI